MQYITGELSKPNATCMVVKDKEAIVGASWGYVYENTTQFAKDKYPPEMENDIKNAMQQVDITDEFFYMSESFILPIQDDQGSLRYRGKGIVNAFYQMFVMEAQLLGLPMIGRTTADSIQVNKALKNFGFENIFGPTNTSDRRQTRIAQNKFVTGKDQQNPTRILYAIGGRR